MARRQIRNIAAWAAALGWAGVIFWFSTLQGSQVPGRFSAFGHLGEYAIFGALLLFALGSPALVMRAVALASAYGVTDELHQLFVRGRTADPVDWLVDTLGALLGALVVAWVWRRIGARNGNGRP